MTKRNKPCTCMTSTGAAVDNVLPVKTGCGRTTLSEFAPGHDAKLKSLLINAHRAGQTLRVTGLVGEVYEVEPMQLAIERGWADFLTHTPKAKAKSTKSAEADRMSAEVNAWQ